MTSPDDPDVPPTKDPGPALAMAGIVRAFRQGSENLQILRGAAMTVNPGEAVALVGPSGAGKSTLLQIAGLLERPDDGEVRVAGYNCGAMNDQQRTTVRRRHVGFVYQYHHLLPEFSALENVIVPQMIAGKPRREARERAERLLQHVGLEQRLTHRPARLSGGEQQRVAIARALANRPLLLIADEPTGNLDPQTADHVFDMLIDMVRRGGLAALIATHNHDLARRMDRILVLRDGLVTQA